MNENKILIVEDEPVHLNVMKAKLEFEGYKVLVAVDGETGLKMIKTEKPDLVLLDVLLPKLDGFDVLENLKKENISVPIIIVSNSGQPVEIDRAVQLGAKDFLVKAEFNPADVLEKVEKILGKASPRNQNSGHADVVALPKKGSGASMSGDKKPTILIVEDDKFLRDLIVQKMQREGLVTEEAVDGESGVKLIKEKRPDLILLDLILPGLDGFEVLRLVKSGDTANIPVIVLSNLGQKEDMDRAIAGGADDFMVKAHFTPGEIVTKIKSVLNKK